MQEQAKVVIVGIVGNGYSSGKGIVGSSLKLVCDWRAVSFKETAFADDLKRVARIMGWNGEKDQNGRRLLQLIGTEGGRDCIGLTVWIDKLAARIDGGYYPTPTVVAVTDLRFPNEADWVRSRGGVVFRVERAGYQVNDPHRSETEGAKIEADALIKNITGHQDEILPQVDAACSKVDLWSRLQG